jgi:hypothetical protein
MSETRQAENFPDPMALGQGDLCLLDSDVAQRLLASRIQASFAEFANRCVERRRVL